MRNTIPKLLPAAVACITVGVLLSCQVVGPNYIRPKMDVPTTYMSATTQDAAPQPAHLLTDWWRLFGDPDLNSLEETAIRNNPDLKAAMARVAEARAAAGQVASQFYPQITFNPSFTPTYSPKPTAGAANNLYTSTKLPFDLSYEVDLWGQVARLMESADANTRASADQYAVVLQTLEADVAQDYINLRAFEAQEAIIGDNIDLTQEQLDIVTKKAQPNVGLAGNIDVAQAKTQLEALREQQIDIRRQRTDVQHALAILLDKAPSEFSVDRKQNVMAIPAVPPGLPVDLLRHRPDVIAAEENLVSANAQIGVALSNFYPTVMLSGAAGMSSVNVQNVFDWQGALISLGPSVSVPIFEGGKLDAGLNQAKARYDELLSTYRSTLLGAFRDVEVSLNDVHQRDNALDAQTRAVAAGREYLRLSRLEYDQGLLSYFQLLSADQTLLTNRLTESQLLNDRLTSTVLLIKAIGGGWNPEAPLVAPPTTGPATAPAAAPTSAPGTASATTEKAS